MKHAVSLVLGVAITATATSRASANNFLDALKNAESKVQQQLQSAPANRQQPARNQPQSQTTAQPATPDASGLNDFSSGDSAPAIKTGTAEDTARLAAAAPAYDVVGIKLGMPARDALATIRAHNASLIIRPDSLKYDLLPQPLVFGAYAASPALVRGVGGVYQPDTEAIYVTLAMQPNQPVVTRVTRFLIFSRSTAPEQDTLAAALEKKYGTASYDSKPGNLFTSGVRTMLWVDDVNGHRLSHFSLQSPVGIEVQNRLMQTSSFGQQGMAMQTPPAATSIGWDSWNFKNMLQAGYGGGPNAYVRKLSHYTVVRALLWRAYEIGISSPDVVGVMSVTVGSDALDQSSIDATHDMLVNAAQAHQAQETQAARANTPDL